MLESCRHIEAVNVNNQRTFERVEQKERTRQKLLTAARALVDAGATLTIARAAQKADVAEATAYRYFSNPRSLLREALSIDWAELDALLVRLRELPSIGARAQIAAEELTRFVLAREESIRLLFASTQQEPRDPRSKGGLPKGSFRRRLVEAVLAEAEPILGEEYDSTYLALIVVISPYAVLTLRDATGLKAKDVPQQLAKMAQRLVNFRPL